MIETEDGGFAISGYASISGNFEMRLIRTNANGTLLYDPIEFGGSDSGISWGVAEAKDGGIVTAGGLNNSGALLNKFDETGDQEWESILGASTAFAVALTPDNGFVVAGTRLNGSEANIFIIKTDENGNF